LTIEPGFTIGLPRTEGYSGILMTIRMWHAAPYLLGVDLRPVHQFQPPLSDAGESSRKMQKTACAVSAARKELS